MTIGSVEAWGLACKHCDALVARHSQLTFLLENAAAVHLTLDKRLLYDEQLQTQSQESGASWRVYSQKGVFPEIKFTKIRTTNAYKRQRLPFELCCVNCNAKVASEGFLDELPDESQLLLDSKACACVLDKKMPYGMTGTMARKWGVILRQLQEMKLPIKIQTIQELINFDGVEKVKKTTELPVVHPTADTIRNHFTPKAKMSKLRQYQVELTLSALLENTIVYLPTGCGKTLVAIKVLDEMKYLNPDKLVVFFVPTGPLVSQQASYIRRESDFRVQGLSGQHGQTSAATSEPIQVDGEVDALVVTPQYFLNLLFNGRTKITDYSVMVFDEAHHATGNHPYCELLKEIVTVDLQIRPHILALTASPFGEAVRETSGQIALNKLAKTFNAVVNSPTIAAEDLEASFIPKEAQWVTVQEGESERKLRIGIKQYIESFYPQITRLMNGQVMPFEANYDTNDMELSQFLAKLRLLRLHAERKSRGNNADVEMTGLEKSKRPPSDLELILEHLRKVASSFYNLSIHGPGIVAESLSGIFSGLETAASEKRRRTFGLIELAYRAIMSPALTSFPLDTFPAADISNRVHLVAECIQKAKFDHNSRAIVFVRRRKTAIVLAKAMEALDVLRDLNPTRFVGHNSYEGMSWEEEQRPTLDRFRQGRIRLLVATNVLEEGLDVPECSLVIQFDGVVGVTSLIQSRGRARHRDSTFIIFCSAVGKERNLRLVENEKQLVKMANTAASKLESKIAVKKLMEYYPETVIAKPSLNGNEELSVLPPRAVFDVTADEVYNIVLGGVFIGTDKQLQASILERISAFVSVRMADERIGLCTVAAPPDQDIYQSYDSLSSGVEFFIHQQSFWMRFESDGMESAVNGHIPENITDVGLRRGLMTPDGAYMELENFGNSGGLEMAADALIVYFAYQRVEFDMRALCEPRVWFDLTSSARHAACVYLAFRLPPSCYIADERECKVRQSHAYAYCLTLPRSNHFKTHLWNLRAFFSKLGVEVRETKIPKADEKKLLHSRLSFVLPVAYALQCFLSDCSHFTNGFLPPEFYDLLTELDPEIQEKALLSFRANPGGTTITDQFYAYLQKERSVLEGLCASQSLDIGPTVYKVIVTPSRIVYCPPVPAPSNRVFRHWGSENFMYVYFRDDNMERLDYTSTTILTRIRNILTKGIEIPGVKQGRKFRFLGCSLSQVRNSSAIFTLLNHHEVRSWIGDLSRLTSPAKYLKRLGQAFSSTKETFNVSQNVLDNPVQDITNDQYVFTDGCGEIALVGAESVVKELNLLYTPSAFQIRLGGAKGVLVVSDLNKPNLCREDSVVLRQSMSKFSSNHTMLEIVACAGKSEAYLTRQSVLILNDLGINEDVFMEMQEEYLSDLCALVASDDGAYFELKAVLPPTIIWWIDVLVRKLGVKILVDEYLSSLARTIYHYRLTNTVMRARIPIAKGRTLMGVADFTGTLKYGEVFVQYSVVDEETGADNHITLDEIDVAVHRSPCHHPGDIRVLRCIANVPPQLRRLKDCIVFPCQGPRPHPDECTGGDLDGDMFVVIWDKRLIPSRAQVREPMVFDEEGGGDTSPRGEEYHQSTDDEGLVDFYVHSIQDDILGVASNAHLALCDTSHNGSLDEDAMILARICSKQVDSLRAEKDLDIVRKLAPKSYPDFMQNKEKPSYQSKKVLGKMYRRCKAIFDTTKDVTKMPIRDDNFLTIGYRDYVDQARILYRQYKLRIRALLLMSGAQTEAELATGMIVEPQSEYKAEYFRFGEQCKDAFYALQNSFRTQFDSDTSTATDNQKRMYAAACYFVAHDDSDATTRSLSFPWIVIDLLTTVKTSNIGSSHYMVWSPVRLSAYAQTIPKLQLCILAEIATKTEELLADLFDRLVAVTSLRSEMPANLNKKELDLILFGSSGLLTFEKQSDLDVMVRCTSSRGSLKAIAKSLEGSHDNIDLKDDIRVPLLSFSFQQWSVELCKHSNGPVKTRLFRTYMERYDFFWPCVYFLVRWGKCVGIIRRRSGGGLDMFSPTGFIWLFIRFCTEQNFVHSISVGPITLKQILKDNDIDSEISFWTKLLTRLVSGNDDTSALSAADVLLTFFSHYASLSTPVCDYGFTDPLDSENDTQLELEAVTLLRSECHIALHQLVIAQGDIKYLLTHRDKQTSRVTLSHALSTRIHEEKDFFSRKILFETKSDSSTRLLFKFHPNSLRSDLYVAEIIGPGDAVQLIEEHISKIEQELGARMPFRSNRNFHHEGSSLVLFEGAGSQQEKIGFQDYFGERHGEHNNIRLHQAHLICFMNGRQWYEHAGATFCAKFIQQMIKLSRYEHLNPGVTKAKAFVRFGHHYLINLPRSFDEETIILASIKKLEDEFERGRTARELYESVLIAKQKQRAQAEVETANQDGVSPEVGSQNDEVEWGDFSGDEQEGWGGDNEGMDSDFNCYNDGGGGGGSRRQKRHQRRPRMQLRKADTVARGDKGVTHSFYSMIERQHAPWTVEYAEKRLGMKLIEVSDSYQVSFVHQSFEYNVRLTNDLQLVKISTRPSRWFSATLKMRQEMDEESHMMDSTPDIRFYVSTTEEMPKTDGLYVKLADCCKNAPDGRGIIEFCDETRDKVRISRHLIDAGESPACIGTVRHVRGATYSNSGTDTQLSLMHIREFGIPDRNPADGFMTIRDKVEAEFLLPPLTPERRLLPAFARKFLDTGMEFVDFLRTHADMEMP